MSLYPPSLMFRTPTGDNDNYLQGKLLVATHELDGTCFERAVIYVCSHSKEGAMGLVVNSPLESLDCFDLLTQLKIDRSIMTACPPIWYGGPVDTGKGFVLHTADYLKPESVSLNRGYAVSSSIRILKDIVSGKGPSHSIIALGYAGWGAGQLDNEIKRHSWFLVEVSDSLLFTVPYEDKWEKALEKVGVYHREVHHFIQVPGNA
jgi:putative transcriptional regulator